ncbi:pentapeptide repeat-containing protein [Rhodococcus sp. IEGM 1241]|uniref:pentapeptide repeat-containing protein n=1 Tax=Rhodococcus sp. IEGM 1241 TaxID=3082228 RepID=UPI0029549086|nr:pentapeptide repeat-containing protein [Rhodococcus sp. IEGM 1241]MDV8014561.1 pentapeptide repeat-containing protein [Rhodococcus sp. IEGM 1241]
MLAGQTNLLADCSSCFGLCCVALPFSKSSDFATNKNAGDPCKNLQQDFRCGIHTGLRKKGFTGCTVYDCFGAGQKVSQQTYDGISWHDAPETASDMFETFPVVRQLHELLWYLVEARSLKQTHSIRKELDAALAETESLTNGTPSQIQAVDVSAHRAAVNTLLLQTSDLVRSPVSGKKGRKLDHRGADLIGAKFRGSDLRGANFRGSYLIGADLRDCELDRADLIGADLRGTDIRDAKLRGSIFLTQFQINAAVGDSATTLPDSLTRPSHWA